MARVQGRHGRMQRAQLFSLDALLALAMLCIMLATLLFAAESSAAGIRDETNRAEKIFLASSVSEALVKNRNAQMPALGAAHYSAEKKRVEANLIDPRLLEKYSRLELGAYAVAAIYRRDTAGKRYFFRTAGKNCFVMERFAIIDGAVPQKTVLGVEICEK